MSRRFRASICAATSACRGGFAYACLCETMLMAFAGDTGAALGAASVDHARRMRDAARRFAHLGFTLADPLSFGRPVTWPAASVDVAPV